MTTFTITNAASSAPIALTEPAATNAPDAARTVPLTIAADEAYYWSVRWQQDVREAMAALKSGDYEEFDSDDPNDIVRWMLSIDDEDDKD